MDETQKVYSIFTFYNDSSIISNITTTIIGAILGACLVYYSSIRLEKKKQKQLQLEMFDMLKRQIIESLEKYRLLSAYIAEYRSKANFQNECKKQGLDSDDTAYYKRMEKFDDFRLAFTETRAKLLYELGTLEEKSNKNEDFIDLHKKIKDNIVPISIDFANKPIIDSKGEICYCEDDIPSEIEQLLSKEGNQFDLAQRIENLLPIISCKI